MFCVAVIKFLRLDTLRKKRDCFITLDMKFSKHQVYSAPCKVFYSVPTKVYVSEVCVQTRIKGSQAWHRDCPALYAQ